MSRLVVVSNRVADPRKTAAGGLAVALAEVLNNTGGLWFGWSGKIIEPSEDGTAKDPTLHSHQAGPVKLVTVDLNRDDHDAYYLGYSNGVLWPVFHYRLDLADFDAGYIAGYRRVNQLFARKLAPLLREDDIIWVHDYHLIPLAAELRALGCTQRIGFFLHIPLPPPLILAAIPGHDWLIRALFAYDLVGFQSNADHSHFSSYVQTEAHAQNLGEGRWRAFNRTVQAGAFPIGIDVAEFAGLAASPQVKQRVADIRAGLGAEKLILGVDRLDYSKGILERLQAIDVLLEKRPELRRQFVFLQVAVPSRTQVKEYGELKRRIDEMVGRVNGRHGTANWQPVRYLYRGLPRHELVACYRAADVCLVTPLRDGMNLVAMEYVACRDDLDGVLVLSELTGAARELGRGAVQVNPFAIHETADSLAHALAMPPEDRRERMTLLRECVASCDVHGWLERILKAAVGEGSRPLPRRRTRLA